MSDRWPSVLPQPTKIRLRLGDLVNSRSSRLDVDLRPRQAAQTVSQLEPWARLFVRKAAELTLKVGEQAEESWLKAVAVWEAG